MGYRGAAKLRTIHRNRVATQSLDVSHGRQRTVTSIRLRNGSQCTRQSGCKRCGPGRLSATVANPNRPMLRNGSELQKVRAGATGEARLRRLEAPLAAGTERAFQAGRHAAGEMHQPHLRCLSELASPAPARGRSGEREIAGQRGAESLQRGREPAVSSPDARAHLTPEEKSVELWGMRVGRRLLKSQTVTWLRDVLQECELTRSAIARELCKRDGWKNRQGVPWPCRCRSRTTGPGRIRGECRPSPSRAAWINWARCWISQRRPFRSEGPLPAAGRHRRHPPFRRRRTARRACQHHGTACPPLAAVAVRDSSPDQPAGSARARPRQPSPRHRELAAATGSSLGPGTPLPARHPLQSSPVPSLDSVIGHLG